MAILTIKSGALAGCRLSLKPGSNRLGRADGNDLVIADASVSSRHCEIVLDGNAILVRDLGSTNGTFIQGTPVTESSLQSGQLLRLGNVEMACEMPEAEKSDPAPAAVPIPVPSPRPAALRVGSAAAPVAPAQAAMPSPALASASALAVQAAVQDPPVERPCANHVSLPAVFLCPKCGKQLCRQCVKAGKVGGKAMQFCVGCGGRVKPIDQSAASAPSKPLTFAQSIPGAFRYPFKGNGLILLVTGAVFFGFLDFLRGWSFSLFLYVVSYGYLFAYMQKIVVASANNEDEPPGWPDISDFYSDVIQPFFLLVVTLLVSFAPGWFLYANIDPLPAYLVLGLGVFFFPMSLLAVCMADSISGLNPLVVVSSILKVFKPYLLVCVLFGALVAAAEFLPDALLLLPIPILPAVLASFASLLLLTIQMRLLGLLYVVHKDRLGWF